MRVKQFRDLVVWQRAMELAREIYRLTRSFPKEEIFGLTSQMKRAAVSIPSNIAEGQGRSTDRAFAVFLGHARGPLFELETQTELAESLGFLSKEDGMHVLSLCKEVGRMLHGLLNSMKEETRKQG
ncbi:four helix bundle protein [Silvibacterium sp.]|uniref:four helix bundle protein n=1 Tax=Silvibacterium sp. TaxID=1964179 RepID=UPI0039E38377